MSFKNRGEIDTTRIVDFCEAQIKNQTHLEFHILTSEDFDKFDWFTLGGRAFVIQSADRHLRTPELVRLRAVLLPQIPSTETNEELDRAREDEDEADRLWRLHDVDGESQSLLKKLDKPITFHEPGNVIVGLYVNTPLSDLQTMRADVITLLANIRKAHQSYSIGGRTFSRAQLADAQKDLAEIDYAIAQKGGTIPRESVADMSGNP